MTARIAAHGFMLGSVLLVLLPVPVSTDSSYPDSSAAPSIPVVDQPRTPIDLTLIRDVKPKGRIQDLEYNPHLQVHIDVLVASGPDAVDFLISEIPNATVIKHHVFNYWRRVHVGDIALVILSHLFTEPSGARSTIPGASWDDIIERPGPDLAGCDLLTIYIEKHGRRALQRKWAAVWAPYRSSVAWDPTDRCFRPGKAARDPRATAPN